MGALFKQYVASTIRNLIIVSMYGAALYYGNKHGQAIAATVYVVHAPVQEAMIALSNKNKEALLSLTMEAKDLRSELTKNTTALTSLCAEVQAFKTLLSSWRSNLHEVQEAKKTGVRKLLELPYCSPLLASQLPSRH